MKKIFYLLIMVFAFSLFTSCEKDYIIERDIPQEPELISVSFSVKTEGVNLVSEEPLVRSSSPSGIYGIRVHEYSDFKNTLEHHDYCYGLFDNVKDLSITFKKGVHYIVDIEYLPDGKNLIVKNGIEYGLPFCRYPSVPVSEEIPFNKIIYDTENTLYGLGGTFDTYKYGRCYHAPFDFFVYKNWDFVAESDKPITLELKRANAGIRFNYKEVEGFNYDEVIVKFVEEQWEYHTKLSKGEANKLVIPLITMSSSSTYFVNHICDYEQVEVVIGTEEVSDLFFRGKLDLDPNVIKTYDVYLKPIDSTTSPIEVTCEQGDMGNESCGNLN